MMRGLIWALAIVAVMCMGLVAFVYAGLYEVAADQPHWTVTTRVLASIRERSIAVRAAPLPVDRRSALIALSAGIPDHVRRLPSRARYGRQ